jgi:hypothetical protein
MLVRLMQRALDRLVDVVEWMQYRNNWKVDIRKQHEQAPETEPEPERKRPSWAATPCARCGNNLSFPHFSCEITPKPFCTWFCANSYHQVHNTGLYKCVGSTTVPVTGEARMVLVLEPNGNTRPLNHPCED